MSAHVLRQLLRSPGEIAEACKDDDETRSIALTSLGAILVGAAVFGGVVGSYRGGAQIAFAAIKIPLVVLATLALSAPAFHAIAAVLGRPWPMRSIVALTLAASARAALVLLAAAPGLWLLFDWGLGYHAAALAAAGAYAIAGLFALGVLLRGLGKEPGRDATAIAFIAVFFAAGAQTSWTLRPYLVRPRTVDVPFVRQIEGSFLDSLSRSSRSAAGVYDHATEQVAPSSPDPGEYDGNM